MSFATQLRGSLCLALLGGARLVAQSDRMPVTSAADVAISEGRLADAEQALFAASSRAAHEPSARGALGAYLASRGRLRVGAVLLEEAREFGGDASAIDPRLARIYAWLGDWSAVAALKRYAVAGPEYDRTRWLAAHASERSGPDSVTVALEPNDLAGLGRIQLTIGGSTLQADINPDVEGLILPPTPELSAQAQQFGMYGTASVAAVYGIAIGAMRITNVPARFSPAARPAIGLDVLAALTPTFDGRAHVLTLHQRAVPASGDSLPILLSFPGVRLVTRTGQAPVTILSAAGRAALRGTRWTFDVRRGAVVVER